MKKVLVTGAYGYIGSHTVRVLAEHGYEVSGMDIDVSSNDISRYLSKQFPYYDRDVSEHNHYHQWFDCVVHLAGLISVEESVEKPWDYIKTNVYGTRNVINNYPSDNIIFASTAAAFNPVSPYAQTKILAESLIKSYAKNYTIFRFFNVAGSNGEYSQIKKSTHLIRIAAEAAAGRRPFMQINGTDWDTPDGTCIRDYIHVLDVVNGIEKSIQYPSNSEYDCIASGKGYSVREVINTMKLVSGVNFQINEGPRRQGDTAVTLMPGNIEKYIDPYYSLEDMCLSAYKAELRRVG